MTDTTPPTQRVRWLQHATAAQIDVDDAAAALLQGRDPSAAIAYAAIAQARATLALVELTRELQHDFRDLRRDVSRPAAHR
jgi:hypothetical protein